MTPAAWFVLILVIAALALVAANKLRADLAALGLAVALGLAQFAGLGVLDAAGNTGSAVKAISGFGQPVVITLLSLFIITRCLEKTGVTRLLARWLLRLGGRSEARLIGLFAAATAFLSLFMNNLAAGALLLPSALEAARRTGIKPSKLLIPVAYGSLLGGVATYFTTANIIVSDLLTIAEPPQARLGVLDFTPTGGLIALAGIAFLALFGSRLLPEREPSISFAQMRPTGSELEDAYQVGERLWQARIRDDSPLAGKTLVQAALGERLGVAAVAVWRDGRLIFPLSRGQILLNEDVVWIVGRAERMLPLREEGLDISESREHISTLGLTFIEVLLAPRSAAEGRSLKELDFRGRYGFNAIALLRKGRSYRTNVADFKLEPGELAAHGRRAAKPQAPARQPEFYHPRAQPERPARAAPPRAALRGGGPGRHRGFDPGRAGLPGHAGRGHPGDFGRGADDRGGPARGGVAGHLPHRRDVLGQPGDGQHRAGGLDRRGDGAGRRAAGAARAGGRGLPAHRLLTQVMGGQVSALVSGPVAISAAISLGVNPQAIAVATAIGCSASFLTPLAHPVNVLMIGPANYTFGDFFKVGWPLTVVCFVMLMLGMKVFWGL